MALNVLLHDTPLIMQSSPSGDLPSKPVPTFLGDSAEKIKVVVLHLTSEGGIVIQAASNGMEMIVGANGGCYFESPLLGISEQFYVETLADQSLAFVSCRTGNVLEADSDGKPRCVDTIRHGWFILQHSMDNEAAKPPVVSVSPAPHELLSREDAGERREYIMKLVALGKSLDEIDAILLRMYSWPMVDEVASSTPVQDAVPVNADTAGHHFA